MSKYAYPLKYSIAHNNTSILLGHIKGQIVFNGDEKTEEVTKNHRLLGLQRESYCKDYR